MEYDYRAFEPSPAFIRALRELQILQTKRRKMAEVVTRILGDGEIVIEYPNGVKTFAGAVAVIKSQDSFQFELRSNGVTDVVVPWKEVVCCNLFEKTVILQLKIDYFYEKCTVKFFEKSQADLFISLLPKIKRPTPIHSDSSASSDSEFNDSGNEPTHQLSHESLYNPEVSEDGQEL